MIMRRAGAAGACVEIDGDSVSTIAEASADTVGSAIVALAAVNLAVAGAASVTCGCVAAATVSLAGRAGISSALVATGPLLAAGLAITGAGAGFTSSGSVAGGRATTVVAAAVAGLAGAAVAGGRATMVFAGGAAAIAGAGATITLGAGRGCGTTLRGSGRGGTIVTGGCFATGGATAGAGGAAFAAGAVGLRAAACSACCLLARIAFAASPGLEMPDRSIFGRIAVSARALELPDAAFPPFFR